MLITVTKEKRQVTQKPQFTHTPINYTAKTKTFLSTGDWLVTKTIYRTALRYSPNEVHAFVGGASITAHGGAEARPRRDSRLKTWN